MTATIQSNDRKRAKPRLDSDGFGAILANAVYTLEAFRRISGLDKWSLREAMKDGLRAVRVGRRKFIRGVDFDEYLLKVAESESADTA